MIEELRYVSFLRTSARPVADELSAPFWDGAATGVLRIQQCAACRSLQHPPERFCRRCFGRDLAFASVNGAGTVYTYTTVRTPTVPGAEPPYTVVVVALDAQPDVLMLTAWEGEAPLWLTVGLHLEVAFDSAVPQFGPTAPVQTGSCS